MKTFALTLTCKNKTSDQNRGFIKPPQHRREGTSTSVGGFSFGLIAPIGAIQLKEVASTKAGINLHYSKIANQVSIQRGVSK